MFPSAWKYDVLFHVSVPRLLYRTNFYQPSRSPLILAEPFPASLSRRNVAVSNQLDRLHPAGSDVRTGNRIWKTVRCGLFPI